MYKLLPTDGSQRLGEELQGYVRKINPVQIFIFTPDIGVGGSATVSVCRVYSSVCFSVLCSSQM